MENMQSIETYTKKAVGKYAEIWQLDRLSVDGPNGDLIKRAFRDDRLAVVNKIISEALQSLADEMVKDIEALREIPPYSMDPSNPIKHIFQNEGYAKALDDVMNKYKK